MKSVHSALVLILCLAMGCNPPAASASPHSGTSPSYKSGFSSQKSNSARSKPAPPPAGRQSGPGAFGKSPGSPASAQPQRNSSSMARDMDQSAARANALKTLDARRAAASVPPPLPPLNDTVMRPRQQPVYQAPPPVYQGPAYQQQPSSGLMHGLLGFMLGRAMSQSNQPVSYPTASSGQPNGQANGQMSGQTNDQNGGQAAGGGMLAGMPGLGAPVPAAAAPAPAPSFGASVLRWFIWLGVLSIMAWAVVYAVRKLRRLRAGNATHYSFERN